MQKRKKNDLFIPNPGEISKLLRFSTAIDEWEQNILFAENGFYSLAAREAEEQYGDYLVAAEEFMTEKLSDSGITGAEMLAAANRIKNKKLEMIKQSMLIYIEEAKKLEISDIFRDSIMMTIKKSILNKNNPSVIEREYSNGLMIIKFAGKDTNTGYSEETYKNEFFTLLIEEFLKDKDLKAFLYFEKYRHFLSEENRGRLEKYVTELKVNIIAGDFVKEADGLSKEEIEREIKLVNDEKIEKQIRRLLSEKEVSEKTEKELQNREKNLQSWTALLEALENKSENPYLYIDYGLKDENIKHKEEYISKIKRDGIIKSDKSKAAELLKKFSDDFGSFRKADLSDYRLWLDKSDFANFASLQNAEENEYKILKSDFDFVLKHFSGKYDEDFVDFIELYLAALKEYKSKNNNFADFSVRNKLISEISTRYKETERNNK